MLGTKNACGHTQRNYRHPGPLRSELKVSKACLAPKSPKKARSARLLDSADLRFSIGYESKPFDKDRKAKVSKDLGFAMDLNNTSVRSASSVLPKARLTLSPRMTILRVPKIAKTAERGPEPTAISYNDLTV